MKHATTNSIDNMYCQTRDIDGRRPSLQSVVGHLSRPIIFNQKDIMIPYSKIKICKIFNSKCLDYKYTEFDKRLGWIGITYEYSNYTKYNHLDINSYKYISLDWFNRQAHYIKSLSRDEIFTLLGYSDLSYPVVNTWCNTDTDDSRRLSKSIDWWSLLKKIINYYITKDYFPFFYQVLLVGKYFDFSNHQQDIIQSIFDYDLDSKKYNHFIEIKHEMSGDDWKSFWNDVVSEYVDNLDQIIKRAPKTTSYMTVWRGTKTPYWKKNKTIRSFTSTSLDIDVATEFTSSEKKCCLARIIIPPNIRCLFLGSLSIFSEAEILIGRNSIFKVDPIWMKEKDTITLPYKSRSRVDDLLLDERSSLTQSGDDLRSSLTDIEYELCGNLDIIETTILNFEGYK